MKSTKGDPVNLRPNELSSSLPPTQDVVDIFANTMEILEGQNLVLIQLVQNVIHDRHQGLRKLVYPTVSLKQYWNLLWSKFIYQSIDES
jgi:hypothetical protein